MKLADPQSPSERHAQRFKPVIRGFPHQCRICRESPNKRIPIHPKHLTTFGAIGEQLHFELELVVQLTSPASKSSLQLRRDETIDSGGDAAPCMVMIIDQHGPAARGGPCVNFSSDHR